MARRSNIYHQNEAAESSLWKLKTWFFVRYFFSWAMVQLLAVMLWNAVTVVCRRLVKGPKRPRWTWLYEILIEQMHVHYAWHLQRAKSLPLLSNFHHKWERRWMEECGLEEEPLRTLCAIHLVRVLIQLVPLPPYWPRAQMQIHHVHLPQATTDRYPSMEEAPQEPVRIDEITHFSVPETTQRSVLFVHGGAYCLRMEASWRGLCSHYSRRLQAKVFVVHYRLAPEHPFPAPIQDVVTAYLWLTLSTGMGGRGFPANQCAIIGESAGGGAVVSALLRLRQLRMLDNDAIVHIAGNDRNLNLPACTLLNSPWLDLTCESTTIDSQLARELQQRIVDRSHAYTGNSWIRHHAMDILHYPVWPFDLSGNYVYGLELRSGRDLQRAKDPCISPAFADSAVLAECLPAMLVQVGEKESLHDEAVVFVNRLNNHFQQQQQQQQQQVEQEPPEWFRFRPYKTRSADNTPFWQQPATAKVHLEVYEDMTHVFQLFWELGDATAYRAVERGCLFLDRHLQGAAGGLEEEENRGFREQVQLRYSDVVKRELE